MLVCAEQCPSPTTLLHPTVTRKTERVMSFLNACPKLTRVVHTCKLRAQVAEAGGFWVQGQTGLYTCLQRKKLNGERKKVGVGYKKVRLELRYLTFRVLEGATQAPGGRKRHQWSQATVNPTSYNANLSDNPGQNSMPKGGRHTIS